MGCTGYILYIYRNEDGMHGVYIVYLYIGMKIRISFSGCFSFFWLQLL